MFSKPPAPIAISKQTPLFGYGPTELESRFTGKCSPQDYPPVLHAALKYYEESRKNAKDEGAENRFVETKEEGNQYAVIISSDALD